VANKNSPVKPKRKKETGKRVSPSRELEEILQTVLQNDAARRTYQRIALEGLVKAAVRGNLEATKFLIRQVNLAEVRKRLKGK
jgi:hypothetical protein